MVWPHRRQEVDFGQAWLTPNGTDAAAYTPYSLLRSVDELFGLAPLGKAEGKKVHSFASAFVATETAAGD